LAVRRRNASNPTPAIEGNATLTKAFVEDAFMAIHKFVRRQRLFIRGLRLRFKETRGSTIRPLSIKDSFYFMTEHAIGEDLRMFLRIALKLSKKTLRIDILTLVKSLFVGPKVFE